VKETMNYRQLGNTGLRVSVLGYGSSPLGNVYGTVSTGQIQRAIDVAIDHGINFFDTSPYYGLTLAEERLGMALAGKRERIILATKCGRYGLDAFDFSRARIRTSVEESLRRLQTDHVDLLQAHDIEFAHQQQIVEETLPALRELQAEGKALFVGITGYSVSMLRRVAEAVPVDTILSYCRYSLLNADMQEVLAPMADTLGLINASPLMMGALTESGTPAWHAASSDLKAAGLRAAQEAKRNGASIETLALQFAMQQEFAASTLIGMSSADEVKQNVAAITQPVDPTLMQAVLSAIGNGFASTWPSGLPENGR
jgi:L-galactose dehydrogenase